jgi:hypothetical protein
VVGNRAGEVEFVCDPVAEVNTEVSGLQVARGNNLNHRWFNTNIRGMSFRVTHISRESRSADSAPGVITLTGGKITGPVYPGVEYSIVVSGNSVAANNVIVVQDAQNVVGNIDNRWRLFDVNPYETLAFTLDPESVEPPKEDDETPPAQVVNTLILNEHRINMPAKDGSIVARPFRFVTINDGANIVSMVNPRIIADFFGANVAVSEGPLTATITGVDKAGAPLEIVLTDGLASARINGVDTDIATFAPGSSPVPGSVIVTNLDDRFYVPLRFIVKAFGYESDLIWDQASLTATINYIN